MKCPNCHSDIPAQPGQCPHCGVVIIMAPSRTSFATKNVAWVIPVVIVVCAAVLVAAGFGAYRFLHKKGFAEARRQRPATPVLRPSRVPVEHGSVVRSEELVAHGKLYFVPVGRQAIPVQSLADYYREKFKIDITVLTQVRIHPSDCVRARKQCVAEELIADMTDRYPKIAWKRDSVMIALTDEDIFPRRLGWEFTYSLHSARFAIVSTRRMDPAFWGDRHSDAERRAATRQMLTKYVAMTYFHLPESFDPTSIMYSPLTPNGGPDDLYESDLHPEQSVNGYRGTPYPCLFFRYSYKTHKIKPDRPVLSDCKYDNPANSTDDETFMTNLGWGLLVQRSMDLELSSTPVIEFRRGYKSDYLKPFALGLGTNHTFDTYLSSDGLSAQTMTRVNREDGVAYFMGRTDQGRGFDPSAVYLSEEDPMYGARETWVTDHYKIQYRDGSWSTYLACAAPMPRCVWTDFHDAKGNQLRFERGTAWELRQLTASDHQGLSLQSDDKHRTTLVKGTNGKQVSYEYEPGGCLARVHRADGQTTFYTYDPEHHMTSVSVARRPGAAPEKVLTNEYDAQGRVVKHTLAGIGVYQIQYLRTTGGEASEWKLTDPAGQTWRISMGQDFYIARTTPVRFPSVVPRVRP
ncbi:MAG TPA: zinc ribbon domain-containing protein [Verrucomicrobiae bacterium]|jgi:YD repeat-containing protein|nr:zinc ribbon domain-containing protein [Verrucomicrobiae bacterium]